MVKKEWGDAMSNPLVSVVIPVFNCDRFIAESVHSALAQTMEDLEIIVIDDASTDHTADILAGIAAHDRRIRLFRNKQNMGVANTRNRAFGETQGQYIAFLDGDDIWLPEKLEKQLAMMNITGCDFCYTAYSFINEIGHQIRKPYLVLPTIDLQGLILENIIGCSTVLCKAELLERFHMRSEYAHEDYVLWLEFLRAGFSARGVSDPLMMYRLSDDNRSRNKVKAARNRWKVYRNLLNMNISQSILALCHYTLNAIKKAIG